MGFSIFQYSHPFLPFLKPNCVGCDLLERSFNYLYKYTNFIISKLLGSEVDKPSKILIKTSTRVKYIESNIQNTEPPRIDNPII